MAKQSKMEAVAMIRILLACLALGSCTTHAAVIYGIVPESERLFGVGQRSFDFDDNGVTDLTFLATSLDFQFLGVRGCSNGGPIAYGAPELNAAAVLGVNFRLPAELESGPYYSLQNHTFQLSALYSNGGGVAHEGPWANRSGFLGFTFYNSQFQAFRFGWVRMAEQGGVLELYDWAYESQDVTPIITGQIPEPSVSLLITASVGWLSGRRRRRLP
jgi:hypothetical protein